MQTKEAYIVKRRRQRASTPDGEKHSNVVSFRLSSEAYEKVSEIAQAQGQTFGETVRQSLFSHLKLT